jgi:hypothetical protein
MKAKRKKQVQRGAKMQSQVPRVRTVPEAGAMSHRLLRRKDFEGKTIRRVDVRAVNIIRFYFTDGSSIAIEHERDGMVACDACCARQPSTATRCPSKLSETRSGECQDEPHPSSRMGRQRNMTSVPCASSAGRAAPLAPAMDKAQHRVPDDRAI